VVGIGSGPTNSREKKMLGTVSSGNTSEAISSREAGGTTETDKGGRGG